MQNSKVYSNPVVSSKFAGLFLACKLTTLLTSVFIYLGIACSTPPQTAKKEKPEKIAFRVEIMHPQKPTAQEALDRGRISDAILIYKFKRLHGRIDEESLDSSFDDIESNIGRPGFCRELALAFSSAERVQANYLNEGKLESADQAGEAVKKLQQRYTVRNCEHYWFKQADILEQNNEYENAVLSYFLAAEYLEISREKLLDVLNRVAKKEGHPTICNLLQAALKLTGSQPDEQHEKNNRYHTLMIRLAAENIRTLMEVEKCTDPAD